jgi:LysR family transcriptional regulator for bpeEF and oprC
VNAFHQYCGKPATELVMDRLRRIEILVRVADAGSFSKAARSLLLSPSAVSHAITQLEQELGVRLFYRTTRQMRPTLEGAEVVLRGRDVLERMAELDTAAHGRRDRVSGVLRIGVPSGVSRHVVMPRIADFMRQFPEVRLQVMNTGSVRDMHVNGADINIHLGEMADSTLVSRRLGTLHFGVYGSPDYLRIKGTPQHPEELSRHSCLVHKSPRSATLAPWNQWQYVRGTERGIITVPDTFATDDREALLVAAEAGAGLFRIGMFTPKLIDSGRLVRVLAEWQWPGGPVLSVVYRKQSPQPLRIAAFIQFLAHSVEVFDPAEYTLVHHGTSSSRSRQRRSANS